MSVNDDASVASRGDDSLDLLAGERTVFTDPGLSRIVR